MRRRYVREIEPYTIGRSMSERHSSASKRAYRKKKSEPQPQHDESAQQKTGERTLPKSHISSVRWQGREEREKRRNGRIKISNHENRNLARERTKTRGELTGKIMRRKNTANTTYISKNREEGGEKSRGRFLCFIFFLFSCALFFGLIEAFVAFSLPRSSCPDSRDTIRYPIMALLNIPQRAVIARGQSMSRFGIKNEIRSEQYFFCERVRFVRMST